MEPDYYIPSNGTEGCGFVDSYCAHCIHEKFMHTQDHSDKQCPIFNKSILDWPSVIEEWVIINGNPTCTEYKHWDWGDNDDGDGFNEPPETPPDDPNQLCMPFIFDELEIKHHETNKNTTKQTAQAG